MEAPEWRPQGRFGRPPVGPTRGVLFPGVCLVGPQVRSQCPLDFEVVWVLVGPSIHVTSTCHPMILGVCLPWIGDMTCMHRIIGGGPSLAEVMWHGS
jgi:hypothetical protein